MKLQFKKCEKRDLKELSKISRETFIAAFESQNNPIDFKHYINKAFSFSKLEEEVTNINSHFFFIYLDKELVGYFKLNEFDAQTDLKEIEGIELERIYVKEKFQGKKLGADSLTKIVKIANQKKKQYIWLGVWENNLDAIRFYKKHNFHKFDTHPYYIGNDKQTDWLMRKEL